MLEQNAVYTRAVKDAGVLPVQHGRPVQGTWLGICEPVDLLAIQKPFALPLPPALRGYRIKEWMSFVAQDETVFFEAFFADIKYYSFAEVFFFDKVTKEKLRYSKVLPFHPWRMPVCLANSSVESKNFGFFFNIHCWLEAELIKLDINIAPSMRRPAFTANLEFDLSLEGGGPPFSANLLFSERRSMFTNKALSPVRGKIKLGGKAYQSMRRRTTTGIFRNYKGFFPYRMRTLWCNATGFDEGGRRFGFTLGESQTRDSNRDNENGFWLDGRLTLLPWVKITQTGDGMAEWVIQDTEGMVDLTFTPLEPLQASFNLILTKSHYFTPLGKFNGMLRAADGEKFRIANVWGTVEQLYLRV